MQGRLQVSFRLLGLLAGYVGLRGRLQAVGDAKDTVKVQFEPPELSLGSAVVLRIGPPSSVQLTTTYLDERVRLGLGSRGSLFVFRRGGVSDHEGAPRHGGTVTSCQCYWMIISMCKKHTCVIIVGPARVLTLLSSAKIAPVA